MTFQTIDEIVIQAATATGFFERLRQLSFNPQLSLGEYIKATARAATMQTGATHRGTSAETLLADLIFSGLVVTFEPIKKPENVKPVSPWFL